MHIRFVENSPHRRCRLVIRCAIGGIGYGIGLARAIIGRIRLTRAVVGRAVLGPLRPAGIVVGSTGIAPTGIPPIGTGPTGIPPTGIGRVPVGPVRTGIVDGPATGAVGSPAGHHTGGGRIEHPLNTGTAPDTVPDRGSAPDAHLDSAQVRHVSPGGRSGTVH